ncbi:PAS-containing histidine kinase sensor protein [Rickettsiales endosymbiont of Paramecium tredecaurelia]|uniref:sensor histidine kinase n=1 Tax=Candidatus Sarmatiella mevalonica TaxID=2770581 RepID=UPI00192414B6|nr:ATP-binding protein [Candidatus Sarmatiella mevalonica]MBL3284595.1 PAS-containing histidine kinase sensor protein [Candidatus Sarmatiella mevalonica]
MNKTMRIKMRKIITHKITIVLCAALALCPLLARLNPSKLIWAILTLLMIGFVSCALYVRRYIITNRTFIFQGRLSKQIIITFGSIIAIPTLVISFFSLMFFYFGIQNWFDNKILRILDESSYVAQAYISENKNQLKEATFAIAHNLTNRVAATLSQEEVTKILNTEAENRGLDEVILFNQDTQNIAANNNFNFMFAVLSIPLHIMQNLVIGEIAEINNDPEKLKNIIKLDSRQSIYLIASKLIDKKVLYHLEGTQNANDQYHILHQHILGMEIRFLVSFILATFILLSLTIVFGVNFAKDIISPIESLAMLAKQAEEGSLNIKLPTENLRDNEIRDLALAFNHMISEINRKNRELVVAQRAHAWSDVAQRVAHEVKNPLTPIHLCAERLSKKFGNMITDPEHKEMFLRYTQTILRHTDDIKKIVSEFVNFARMPKPVFEQLDIVSFVKSTVESRALICEDIYYQFNSNIDTYIMHFDNNQMHQVLINLMKNAEESLTFDVVIKQKKIIVNVTKDCKNLIISIEDNGPGFDENFLAQTSTTYVTTRAKGMGLGLAIVRRIIADHNGNLELNNSANGAIISIIFLV